MVLAVFLDGHHSGPVSGHSTRGTDDLRRAASLSVGHVRPLDRGYPPAQGFLIVNVMYFFSGSTCRRR